jgi:hypothetical protein
MARSERFRAFARGSTFRKPNPIEIRIRLYRGRRIYLEGIATLYQGVSIAAVRATSAINQGDCDTAKIVQHPVGGATPGVAAAPVAFAGAIMAGLARSIETLSLHAAEFGVGITVIAGSMLVPARLAVGD